MTTTETKTRTKTRTITLTGRPPVKIRDNEWPIIAEAADSDHDNQYEFQANRKWNVWIKARQHADGRTIVYGMASYDSLFLGEHDYTERAGLLLAPGEDVARAIESVAGSLAAVAEDQEDRIGAVKRSCIAGLPAEEI